MKKAWLLLGALALSVGLTLASSDRASAVNNIFLQEDSVYRARSTPPFNGATHVWAYGPYDTIWTDDGTFHAEAAEAVRSWQLAVPQLSFVYSPTSYYLYFRKDTCFPTEALGCFNSLTFVADAARAASYTWTAQIRIPEPERWTSLGREDILRHEIGHWIGLHEQYIESTGACSGIFSVMNAMTLPNGHNCMGVNAPTSWDVNSATRFWRKDNLESPSLSLAGNLLTLNWTDAMWAEVWHHYTLWYFSWSTNQWVRATWSSSYNEGIGFHKETIARTMARSWDIAFFGWPRGTYYAAAVSGWGWAFETWSPQVDSPLLYVP
jgi:hypothetical protein